MAAVLACSSPQKKFKKFKAKSAEGCKVTRFPELVQEVVYQGSGAQEQVVVRRADSVFNEQPSTTRGTSARFECLDEEWLDVDEDVEEQVIPALKGVVRETTHTVLKVVRDHFGNRRRDVVAGSLPRGEEFKLGSVGFGVEWQYVGIGTRVNVASGARTEHMLFGLSGIPLFVGPKNKLLRGILVANWVWMGRGSKLAGWARVG
ncbi:hypothetical protein NDU88_005276 [Pleurodeles waltl]|uniref:Uncharacterized protein n=1 Tax=Pleurodeles waltl TaxID=8319 RepID=A0AAV7RLN6_PLEWA|nr:hypothetical protein NDU88_005276 [Pleurodeles waltl]